MCKGFEQAIMTIFKTGNLKCILTVVQRALHRVQYTNYISITIVEIL